MYKVFKQLFSVEEIDSIVTIFNNSNKDGWRRLGAVGSDSHAVDYSKSRVAVAQMMHPGKVPSEFALRVLTAVEEVDQSRKFEFQEGWTLNKYKATEKGHFYWHKDRLDGFMYHGSAVGKLSAEKIFINNMRPHREMSVSVALNNRSDYNGGQFIIDTGDGNKTPIDLNKGDAVVFDSDTFHGVQDVTEGERLALVIWLVDREKVLQWNRLCSEQGVENV